MDKSVIGCLVEFYISDTWSQNAKNRETATERVREGRGDVWATLQGRAKLLLITDLDIFIEPEIKLATPVGSQKKQEFQKNVYFCFIDYAKAFDCVDYKREWKILQEMGIPDHLTCLPRNLYADQEATVRTGHGTRNWFQIRKALCQSCILSPCLFNLYAEYIMRNAGLEETQAGIKIARRNINNLGYADDTTLMAEKEE